MAINERVVKLIEKYDIQYKEFASLLGVSRQTITNITSNSVRPSLEVIEKILKQYPRVNARWLITGEGEMFSDQQQEPEKILKESGASYNCENCKRLNNIIEKQEKLIDQLEKRLSQETNRKAI